MRGEDSPDFATNLWPLTTVECRQRPGLRLKVDDQFLRGDGTRQNMTGLLSRAGVNIANVAATLTLASFLDAISMLQQNRAGPRPPS